MKVSWEYFAKRRKINIEMFQALSYDEFVKWCAARNVDPMPKGTFDAMKGLFNKPEQQEVPPSVSSSKPQYESKDLKKLRKPALVQLCEESNVSLKGNETKNQLVSLLLSLNNSI